MDISQKTRFGLKAIIALSSGGHHPFAALAAAIGAPNKLLGEVLADLRSAGLIGCRPGQHGGFRLERLALDFTVADVIGILEDAGRLAPCSGRGGRRCPGCPKDKICFLQPALAAADEAALAAMAQITIVELMAPRRQDFAA